MVAERVFATPWQFRLLRASGQPAMACYQRRPDSGRYLLSALNVLTFQGEQVAAITSFLDPGVLDRFGLPPELPAPDR